MSDLPAKAVRILPPGWGAPVAALGVAFAYYAGARFGLAMSFKPDYIATFWPPNAIILAALLLSHPRKWWYFLAASVPAELLADLPQGISLLNAIGFLIADWCEVLVAALLVRRMTTVPPRFDTVRQLALYILCAAAAAPLVSSLPGVTASTYGLAEVNFWIAARTWFLSDSMTHFVLTPALLLWISTALAPSPRRSTSRMVEEAAVLALTVAVSTVVFGSGIVALGNLHALLLAPLPLLLWSALRFGPRGIFTSALAVTLISVWNASHGKGPFAGGPALGNVLDLQLFLYLCLLPLTLLSSLIEERNTVMRNLAESREELELGNKITRILITVPDDEMYGEVLQTVLDKTGSRHGVFGYLDEKGDLVSPSLTRDIWEECQVADKTIVFPRSTWGERVWGKALREGETVLINTPLPVPPGHIPVSKVLVVPIVHAGRAIGLFMVGNRKEDYGEKDVLLLEGLASRIAPVLLARLERDRREKERDQASLALKEAFQDLERQNLELRQLDEMKNTLMRDVTHELKTPVAKHAMQVEILSSLLARQGLNVETVDALATIRKGIKRQESVIQNILTFSRLEAGARAYRSESVRLDVLLEEVLEDYRQLLRAHRFEVLTELPSLSISSDKDMLWHVFSNLVGNSIKYRRKEGPRKIEVRLEQLDGDARITLSDNGVGLTAEQEEKAFGRFYQASASTDGIGMGLTIVKMIVEGLGGDTRLESEGEGHGATAVVTLPSPR